MKIDKDKALELLEQVVQENGADHTAECVYFQDGEPVCIIGQVLAKLGIRWSDDEADDGFASGLRHIRHSLENEYGLTLTDEAFEALCSAQGTQDALGTWGEALEDAKGRVSV